MKNKNIIKLNTISIGYSDWLKNARKRRYADKMIKEMRSAGLSYDQMLDVLKSAKQKLNFLKQR